MSQLLCHVKVEVNQSFLTLVVFSDESIFKKLVIRNPNGIIVHNEAFKHTQVQLPVLYRNSTNSQDFVNGYSFGYHRKKH